MPQLPRVGQSLLSVLKQEVGYTETVVQCLNCCHKGEETDQAGDEVYLCTLFLNSIGAFSVNQYGRCKFHKKTA